MFTHEFSATEFWLEPDNHCIIVVEAFVTRKKSMTLPNIDGYDYYISNDSDDERFCRSSSEEEVLDEVEVFLYGTPKQKRKALKNLTGDEASSSGEDFEQVMKTELDQKVKDIENEWKSLPPSEKSAIPGQPCTSQTADASKPKYYDEIYFDSDEEGCSKRQRLTDDELLYDPKADDEDQKWADRQRRRRPKKGKKKNNRAAADDSDAVLTCPACMTVLCMDCQRHAVYPNQFRAMFVLNCTVQYEEVLHYKEKRKREFKRHKRRGPSSGQAVVTALENDNGKTGSVSQSRYHPVKCTVCQTEVAVYDDDEIYHFFNVLSGHA